MLDLLMRLEGEARKAGGRVHALLGNHEVMNMLGDLRYVNAEEYKAFRSRSRRGGGSTTTRRPCPRRGRARRPRGKPFDEDAFRAKFLQQVPLGFIERTAALSAEGRYGRWLRAAARHREGQRCRLRPRRPHPRGGGARLRGGQRQGAPRAERRRRRRRRRTRLDPRRRRERAAVVPGPREGRRVDPRAAGGPGAAVPRGPGDRGGPLRDGRRADPGPLRGPGRRDRRRDGRRVRRQPRRARGGGGREPDRPLPGPARRARPARGGRGSSGAPPRSGRHSRILANASR